MCREIAACGAEPWGDIAVEGTTQFVDAAFAGTSDGSPAQPWTTIQNAIDAAAPGAIVAVAAGSYPEPITIEDKLIRLWGRCPRLVSVTGEGPIATIAVRTGAAGTTVRGLSVVSPTHGILVSGSEDVVLQQVWIRDALGRGLLVQSDLGSTDVLVAGSLIEGAHDIGAMVAGADLTFVDSVVRDTQPRAADQMGGRGISATYHPNTRARARLSLSSSLVERNHDIGIFVHGSDGAIEASVVRATKPRPLDGDSGRGVSVQDNDGGRGLVTIQSSVIEANHDTGLFIAGSDATIEGTVVRDTQPSTERHATGILVRNNPMTSMLADATVRASLVERNHGNGIVVTGSTAGIEATRVRDTQSGDGDGGLGVKVRFDEETGEGANAALRWSVVEQSRTLGVFVTGAELAIEATVVRATLPRESDQVFGRGVHVQGDDVSGQRTNIRMGASIVDESYDFGLLVHDADAEITGSIIRRTLPAAYDGLFGDGVSVFAEHSGAAMGLNGSRVDESARAGLSVFGANVSVGGAAFWCNPIHMNSEAYGGAPYTVVDLGGNACGCDAASGACKVVSAGLAPPTAVADP